MPPRMLTLALVLGSALCVAASSLSAAHGRPPEVFLPVGVSGAVYVISGYFIARRQPQNRIGYALMLIGAVPPVFVTLRYLFPVTETANVVVSASSAVLLLAYVLLAFPTGHLVGRAQRMTIALLTGLLVLIAIAELLTVEPALHGTSRCPPCPPNPIRVTGLEVYPVVATISFLTAVSGALAVATLATRRWLRAHGALRQVLAPVLFGGIVTALGFLVTGLGFLTGARFSLSGQFILVLRLLVPIGLAVTFVRFYAARGAVAGAVVQLGASPSAEGLESALRRALHDPTLVVARWSEPADAYLDREGHPVDPATIDAGLDAIRLERDGRPLAAVIHDAALAVDPALVRSVAEAVRFAVDATDIRDRLHATVGDAAVLPQGTIAFLFGDLEGSTELLSRLGNAYVEVLAQLRQIVREVANEFAGHVVEVRADECFLVFADPRQSVAAAVEIQRRLAEATWPAGERPQLRIGIHVGTPNLTPDGYVGLDVHLAARVMAAGNGGQVLASGALVTAVGEGLPAGAAFLPLGTFRLRGIGDSQPLFRITARGLTRDTPARAETA